MKRRSFLQANLAAGGLALAAAGGLLKPTTVLASNWPMRAFTAGTEAEVLAALFGDSQSVASKAVTITAPKVGNPEAVPVTVQTRLENVTTIAVVVAGSPHPLCTSVALSHSAAGYYATRIKLAGTARVTAYVQAGGRIHSASASVKISNAGYGTINP